MIHCEGLVKIYKAADLEVFALQGLDLQVEDGELMAIIGNSGSGKSTLLNMLGGLDRPTAGTLSVDGKNMLKMTDRELVRYKRESVGFVWQNNARNLIPYLTAQENVELPLLLSGASGRSSRERAAELLEAVGLTSRKGNKLNQLSGGEQQRVAIGIALANNPKLLLADEPTGSLDSRMSEQILDLFRELNRSQGITIVIVTHDLMLAHKVDRVVSIRDGKTSSEMLRRVSYADELEELERGIETAAAASQSSHVEYAILDKAGRLQVPAAYLESIGARDTNKVKLELADRSIVLTLPEEASVTAESKSSRSKTSHKDKQTASH